MFNKLKILKKMKIKNLIAVAALLLGSTSAFAQTVDEDARSVNDVLYKLETLADESKIATVVGVNPMADDEAVVELSIPAEVEGEHGTYKVVCFTPGWEIYAKDVTTLTESLTIDATNFADDDLDNDFTALTVLANLTITDNEDGKALKAFPDFYDEAIVETLDISGSKNITAVPDYYFEDGALISISLPETVETIGEFAFKGCAALTTVNFPDALTEIGNAAFRGTAITAADLTGTGITQIRAGVFRESGLTSFVVPATVTKIGNNAFWDCKDLATITFAGIDSEDEPALCTSIGDHAFDGTAITGITLPKAIRTLNAYVLANTKMESYKFVGDYDDPAYIYKNAFTGSPIKSFDFEGASIDDMGPALVDIIEYDAFVGCTPLITLYAPQEYIDLYTDLYGAAPRNCKWEAKAAPVKVDGTIAIKNGFAKWFQNLKFIAVDAEKYKAFSVYVDNGAKKKDGTAYFQGLKKVNNRYYIQPGEHVIFQAVDAAATEVEYEDMTTHAPAEYSVLIDEIFTFDQDYTFEQFQTGHTPYFTSNWAWDGIGTYDPDMYVYRLTNNNGIGFRLFSGTTMKGGYDDGTEDTCADAQFFIQSVRKPDAAGRLNVVWLDEDGNVIEGAATAIQGVEKAAVKDGAIYNVAGQKVAASYKGLVIKDGKKYIQK